MFSAACLSDQMDDVAGAFCREFVKFRNKDGYPLEVEDVTLPYACRAVRRELNMDKQRLLRFVWQFMALDGSKPTSATRVKFLKYRNDPRRCADMHRMVYSKPILETSAELSAARGPEFQVVKDAASKLEELALGRSDDRNSDAEACLSVEVDDALDATDVQVKVMSI